MPQGSILGELLFILYINDMPNILNKCEIVFDADDTLIFTEEESEQICYNNRKEDMNNVNIWLKVNKLKLNESKIRIMELNSDSNKTLGFIIDKNLKFKSRIADICKKIIFFKRIIYHVSVLAILISNTVRQYYSHAA